MSQNEKLLLALLSGGNDRSFLFRDLLRILDLLGGRQRIRGDHFVYSFTGVNAIITLQPDKNGKAKPYQVRQVRIFVQENHLWREV